MKKSLILGLCAISGIASAGNLVQNGNFAADPYPANTWTEITTLTGWNIIGNDMAGIGIGYLGGTDQEIDVSGGHDQGNTGISQILNTQAGQNYTLSFDVFTGGNLYTGGVDAYIGGSVSGTSIVGGNEVGTNLQGLTGANLTNDRVLYTYNFTATSGQTQIAFMDNVQTLGLVAQVGNVDVAATPEPSSMLALGLPALYFLRRRKSR